MEVLHTKTKIDFLRMRAIWIAISLLLVAASIYVWFEKGEEKFGVDFRGGSSYVVKFNDNAPIDKVRTAFIEGGFPEVVVQSFEGETNEFSIRMRAPEGDQTAKKVREILAKVNGGAYEILQEDYVGPVIGGQIRRDAFIAGILSLIGILIYVSARFDWRFALGAVIALFHDAIVATGVTVFMGVEVGAATLAAVLTVVGYSVNDTIIIFDRIRENLVNAYKSGGSGHKGENAQLGKMSVAEIMNLSINQTLSRTIITSLTVFIVSVTLWLFGGGAVSDLALTLVAGVVAGTYSSVFIACPVVLLFERGRSAEQ